MIRNLLQVWLFFLAQISFHGLQRNKKTVSRSFTKAKYRALFTIDVEIDWIKQLLQFLQVPISGTPTLYCDNLSTMALTCNPIIHQRTKHIKIDVYLMREQVAKQVLLVQFVSSLEQFADILIKGLSAHLCSGLIVPILDSILLSLSLKGDVRSNQSKGYSLDMCHKIRQLVRVC